MPVTSDIPISDINETYYKKDYITSATSEISVLANRIPLSGSTVSVQAISNDIVFSTPEYVPNSNDCLTSKQIAYNYRRGAAF